MTNDTSTLNGSLLEMKDQLIYELEQKGITVNYDSSTGLLGLIDKIGDIEEIVSFDNLTTEFHYFRKRGNDGFSVTVPSGVTSLGDSCFYSCTGLTSVTIPSSVTNLGVNCFSGCSGLTSVTIPNSVTSLAQNCFNSCTSLTSITIPSSVTSLGTGCFQSCNNLSSVTIPSSVTSIGANCFRSCSGLTSVTIPSSVTSLGSTCFYACTNLVDYQLYWETPPVTWSSTLMPNYANTYFTIPNGTTANYVEKGFPSDKLIERSYIFYDDFTSETLSDNWIPIGTNHTEFINSNNQLVLNRTGSCCSRGGIYYNKQITGDYKVTIDLASGNYDTYAFGLKLGSSAWTYYEVQPKWGTAYYSINNSTGIETVYNETKTSDVSYTNAIIVIEVIQDSYIKLYVNDSLKQTYTIRNGTTDGFIGIVQCCNRTTTINSIKAEPILFYDECNSADGLSNYSDSYPFAGNSVNTLSFNTDEYLLSGSGGYFSGREILALNGVENARLRIKFRLNTTSSGAFNQLFICCDDDAPSTTEISRPYSCRVRNDRLFQYFFFTYPGETTVYTHNTVFSNDWFYLEAEKDGTSWTIRLYDSNLNQLATNTRILESINSPRWYFGLQTEKGINYSIHIKEIIAEPI